MPRSQRKRHKPGFGIASANKWDSIYTVEKRRRKLLEDWDKCKVRGTDGYYKVLSRLDGNVPKNGNPFSVGRRTPRRVDVIDAIIRNRFQNEGFTWREINGFLIDHFPYYAQDRVNQIAQLLLHHRTKLKINVMGKGYRGHIIWKRDGMPNTAEMP